MRMLKQAAVLTFGCLIGSSGQLSAQNETQTAPEASNAPVVVSLPESDARIWVNENMESLAKLYLHFHCHPELSFQEEKTAALLADEWEAAGIQVTRNFGGHGVVGILENGPGPTVMLRTDLDALPIKEQTNLPYASEVRVNDAKGKTVGVMHACGHDIHLTNLIGVARYLASHREGWSGRLMLIGQPAEERGAGAKAMLKDGLFEKFKKPDFAIALHCAASFPTGKLGFRAGPAMANVDSVDIKFFGRGGHGAYPHTTIDPIVIAAKFVLDAQTIVSREIKPTDPAVVTVGSIQGGTKHNIIPDCCELQLTVRSYGDQVRKQLTDAIVRKAKAAAASAGAKEPEVKISEGTPALINDAELAARLTIAFKKQLGAENVINNAEPVMGGEDFSHYGRNGVPSLMYFIGVVDAKRLQRYAQLGVVPPSLHSSTFYPDIEKSIETGVVSMVAAAKELMRKEVEGSR